MAKEVDHDSRQHALLSPSSAKRWMECPGSLALGKDLPELPSSPYSEEGTKAHEVAEIALMKYFNKSPTECWKYLGSAAETLPIEWQDIPYYVGEYVKLVAKIYKKLAEKDDEVPSIYFESRVTFSKNIWGTADVLIATSKSLAPIDFKYGRGVEVEAEDNPQLIIYGLASNESRREPVERIHAFVHQPRVSEKPGRVDLGPEDIIHWKSLIQRAEKRALKVLKDNDLSESNFKVGEWCRFCKAHGVCSFARDRAKQEVVDMIPKDFQEVLPGVTQLTIEDRVRILAHKSRIEKFLQAVEGSLLQRLQLGMKVPGYKLVETNGRRSWKKGDIKQIGAKLKKLGVKKPFRQSLDLVTITEAKRLVPKAKHAVFNKLTEVGEGRQHIAPMDDGRVEAAIEASFTNLNEKTKKRKNGKAKKAR